METGEEIAISRHGRIVARLVPAVSEKSKVDWTKSAAVRVSGNDKPLAATQSVQLIKAA